MQPERIMQHITTGRADKPSPGHHDQSKTSNSTPQDVPKPKPRTRTRSLGTSTGTGVGEGRRARRGTYTEEVDDEVVGEVGEVGDVGDAEERGVEGEGEQRGRSHRPRSGSRAPFYSHSLLEAKVPPPRGRATPRCCPRSSPPRAPLPTPASCCCVCRQGRAASVGGRAEPKAREAEEATTVTRAPIGDFSRRFLPTPLVFPRFSAFPLSVRFA